MNRININVKMWINTKFKWLMEKKYIIKGLGKRKLPSTFII